MQPLGEIVHQRVAQGVPPSTKEVVDLTRKVLQHCWPEPARLAAVAGDGIGAVEVGDDGICVTSSALAASVSPCKYFCEA